MGHLLRGAGSRWVAALAWTAGLAAALVLLDRRIGGPARIPGWQAVPTLGELPPEAGPVLVPHYLPEPLSWPPRRVLHRSGDGPGYWLALADAETGALRLWMGAGHGGEPPAELGPLAHCLAARGCPEGWRGLSRPLTPGQPLHVLTTLPAEEAALILEGLGPPVR